MKVRAAWRCDRCGIYLAGREYSIQHRRSRSAGGVKGHRLDTPWNLVLLCGSGVTGCHGLIETTAARRSEGYEKGFAIEGWAQDPADVPILRHGIEWVIPSLDDDESLPLEDRGLWVPADPILVLA